MRIERLENIGGGEFVIQENGNRIAEMAYTNAGEGKIIIVHTFVEDAFRGGSIGKDLLKAAVEFACEKNLKIVPLCPFAKAEINKTPEYSDVLAD